MTGTMARWWWAEPATQPAALQAVFQPIVELGEGPPCVHAVEGLVRRRGASRLASTVRLFQVVRRRGVEPDMDRLCVSTVFQAAASALPPAVALTVNVHAATLASDGAFPAFLLETAAALVPARGLTVEVVAPAPWWHPGPLRKALANLRDAGMKVALDDVGLEARNPRLIMELNPDYVKIDRCLVKGIHRDEYRRAVTASFVCLARQQQARVVAEGVEDVADLRTVRSMGIELIQGYFFSPPRPASELFPAGTMTPQQGATTHSASWPLSVPAA